MGSPKELLTKLNRKLSPPPEPPQFEYSPWSEPEGSTTDREARREGSRALANSQLYRVPSVDEVRANQDRDNAIAAAFARQAR